MHPFHSIRSNTFELRHMGMIGTWQRELFVQRLMAYTTVGTPSHVHTRGIWHAKSPPCLRHTHICQPPAAGMAHSTKPDPCGGMSVGQAEAGGSELPRDKACTAANDLPALLTESEVITQGRRPRGRVARSTGAWRNPPFM